MVDKIHLPPSWLLVLIGLIMNIAAIIMSSIVLDNISGETAQLSEQKEENLYSIQLAWNHVETLERKREFLLLYLNSESPSKVSDRINKTIIAQLQPWINGTLPALSQDTLSLVMGKIEEAQQLQRDRIDDLYLSNLLVTEQMQNYHEQIAWYKNIGLFLQVFGLALILARDLTRKP